MKSISLTFYFIFSLLVIQAESTKRWLPEVSGYNRGSGKGNVGIFGKAITGLRVSGGLEYRVHIKSRKWLPPVTGNDINDDTNGYAGAQNGDEIDAVAISGGIQYSVHIKDGEWLYPVTGYNIDERVKEGYSGNLGQVIDAITIQGRTYANSFNLNPNQYNPPTSKLVPSAEIYNFFTAEGWTKNAICCLLGNIEVETGYTFNPEYSYGRHAYGLLQWTPGDVLKDWAQ